MAFVNPAPRFGSPSALETNAENAADSAAAAKAAADAAIAAAQAAEAEAANATAQATQAVTDLIPKSTSGEVIVRALETTAEISRRRRLYRGTITLLDTVQVTAATLSPAITDLARADVRMIGFSSGTTNANSYNTRLTLTNTTTLTASRVGGTNQVDADFEVTEWL